MTVFRYYKLILERCPGKYDDLVFFKETKVGSEAIGLKDRDWSVCIELRDPWSCDICPWFSNIIGM
jgi:hypothetical protein